MTGAGIFRWTSGATYEGDFSGSYLHGFGTFVGLDGSIYKGSWRMNIQHGLGQKQYYNSDIYEGSWKEGVKEGSGRYDWSTGDTYIGNWKAGNMCGRGTMKWANGDMFDGLWLDGLKHGSGFYRFSDGGYFFGTWSRDLKDGQGTYYPDGSKLPSIPNWYNSAGYYDDEPTMSDNSSMVKAENRKSAKLTSIRSFSEKLAAGLFRNSGRISNRPVPLENDWCLADSAKEVPSRESSFRLSFTSEDGQNQMHNSRNVVYAREYMQGVLIKERPKNSGAETSNKQKSKNKFPGKEETTSTHYFKRHGNHFLMLNLQLGIRYTVGKITPVPMREVRSSDFGPRARIRVHFPRDGSEYTPPHRSINFYWKDYCPMVFRNLREMFKIDAADYMMSICDGHGLREVSSPGKSGSIFYVSQDEKFVIKTLRKSEQKILLKMLPNYYRHVCSHENTLITKFFGLHQITLKGGREVRFIVMGNMFCTELRIHRRYDLKGSSKGRLTNKDEIKENTTLKDLDLSYKFQMEKPWHEALFKQIALDCEFLESECIIDYSLLLGVHFRAPEHLKALLNLSSTPGDEGESSQTEVPIPPKGLLLVTHEPGSLGTAHVRGSTLRAPSKGNQEVDLLLPGTRRLRVQLGVNMPAQANRRLPHNEADSIGVDLVEVYDVVLYLGIIDILQKYNMKKKIEHTCKSIRSDPMKISAVEPKLYSQRFLDFLQTVFLVKCEE
ncbi:1-phosphatidylinositol-4-phosphate 5-kinase [Ranunculus cassubicifolius]